MRTATARATARAAVALSAGVLVLTGCVTLPQARTDAESQWKPIPGSDELLQDSQRFDARVRKTVAAGKPDRLSETYAGPLLRTTRAELDIADRTDDELPVRTHPEPEFVRPSFDDYPIWYVRETPPPKKNNAGQTPDEHELAVVQSTGAEDPWRVALRADVPRKKLPTLGATVIPNDDKERLGRTPSSIARQFADVLRARVREPDEAKLFTSNDTVNDRLKSTAGWAKDEKESDGAVTIAVETEPTLVRTLTSEDGGAVMLFTVRLEQHFGMPKSWLRLTNKDDPARITLGQKRFDDFLHTVWEWTVVARVPADPSPDQPVELLSVRNDFVEAEGR